MRILNFLSTDATLSMPVATYEALLEKAAQTERERIIKLLEGVYDGDLWRAIGTNSYVGFDIAELIALIKGEQK